MKFCATCGSQIDDRAVICVNCGSAVANVPAAHAAPRSSGTITATKVFLIISCIFQGIYIIPLAWCLPITISYFKKIKNNQPIGTGLKVCTLLFVNLIAGILMLCDNN